jgi:hypothetical protein
MKIQKYNKEYTMSCVHQSKLYVTTYPWVGPACNKMLWPWTCRIWHAAVRMLPYTYNWLWWTHVYLCYTALWQAVSQHFPLSVGNVVLANTIWGSTQESDKKPGCLCDTPCLRINIRVIQLVFYLSQQQILSRTVSMAKQWPRERIPGPKRNSWLIIRWVYCMCQCSLA